jgi:N-acylneuraminate cytidylyltransferase
MVREIARPEIKAIITDVDGTLTDGAVWYTSNGPHMRKFSTLDGHGFRLAKDDGITIIMATASSSPEIEARANYLGCYLYPGVLKKVAVVVDVCRLKNIQPENIAFIGNDIMDLPAMRICGYMACPKDAHPNVIHEVHKFGLVSNCKGGEGAFRHLVDWLRINNWFAIKI